MIDRTTIEQALISMAQQQGVSLNDHDRLVMRTRIMASLTAKEQFRRRITAPAYQWKKPAPRRK